MESCSQLRNVWDQEWRVFLSVFISLCIYVPGGRFDGAIGRLLSNIMMVSFIYTRIITYDDV